MCENLYLNHMVPECTERQITNKVNKERDKPKHRAQERKHLVKLMYSLLEQKWHQSLAKPDKIKFSNQPKQTELAKLTRGKLKGVNLTVETMQTNMCDLWHDICYTTVKQLCSS